MRYCGKCSLTYDESARICRVCGAILDEIPEAPAAALIDEGAEEPGDSESAVAWEEPLTASPLKSSEGAADLPNWKCQDCGERVPGTFDICWNCGGELKAQPEAIVVSAPIDPPIVEQTPAPTAPQQCRVCGSPKIVPDVKICDQGQGSTGSLRMVVLGDPGALFFKDAVYGELKASLCGDCGAVSLHASNAQAMYQKHLKMHT